MLKLNLRQATTSTEARAMATEALTHNLDQIKIMIEKKLRVAKLDPGNWAHIGDLNHANDELVDLIEFLKDVK